MNHPEQIKSAETTTYDDEGNVIPLSQRLNKSKEDIRYAKYRPYVPTKEEREARRIKGEEYYRMRDAAFAKQTKYRTETGRMPL